MISNERYLHYFCDDGNFFLPDEVIDQMLQELNMNLLNMPWNQSQSSRRNLEEAGKAFIFLVYCPSDKTRYLSRQVLKYNVTEILNNIKQIWEKDKDFFEILEKRLDLNFRNILRISNLEKNGNIREGLKTRTEGPLNLPQIQRHIFINCQDQVLAQVLTL